MNLETGLWTESEACRPKKIGGIERKVSGSNIKKHVIPYMIRDEKIITSGKDKYSLMASKVRYTPPTLKGITKNNTPKNIDTLLFNVSSYIKTT
ncbi:hypothetical protein [Yersinia mollaretii]|uniref:hypothetical protein n=1 Tax=Yersinia mollaretii TaxID=33060 RepID=UPI00117DD997|nr:hypothetical protein [Yersinia mollaretii]MDA5527542.1 hypothetical protein [Yersinia mollaretii]MDR7875079.1 hypothetical protein [Yersinia mollaretii]WQC74842.1 hypothetical protein U1Z61_21010 [Yersinia mollaretii]